jgi:hypothetical protein
MALVPELMRRLALLPQACRGITHPSDWSLSQVNVLTRDFIKISPTNGLSSKVPNILLPVN